MSDCTALLVTSLWLCFNVHKFYLGEGVNTSGGGCHVRGAGWAGGGVGGKKTLRGMQAKKGMHIVAVKSHFMLQTRRMHCLSQQLDASLDHNKRLAL